MTGAEIAHWVAGDLKGAGTPCLVAHGGPGLHHAVYRTLDPLASGRALVFWDHRGHGRSERLPDGPIEMALFADDAVALADRLGIGTFSVFGHSFGGWVGQELALRHPDRVSGLVLVSTTPGQLGCAESPDDDQGPPPPAEVAEVLSAEPTTDEDVVAMYTTLAPHFMRSASSSHLTDTLEVDLVSSDGFRKVFGALSTWSAVDRLGGLTCPTLVIGGRHDVFCSPQQATRIARRVPGAREVIFEGSGHFMWLEEPDRFFPTVDAWLTEHSQR